MLDQATIAEQQQPLRKRQSGLRDLFGRSGTGEALPAHGGFSPVNRVDTAEMGAAAHMTPAGQRYLQNQRGSALLVVLVMIVIVGLVAGIAGSSWQSLRQRAREAELFWRGDQYRQAIRSYYEAGKGASSKVPGQFPAKLEDLVKDPRSLATKKHIRRLYTDPMTGGDWEPVKDQGGRITGVRSSSELEPFQQDNFPDDYDKFVGAGSYSAWEFVYQPKTQPLKTTQAPGQTPPASEEAK